MSPSSSGETGADPLPPVRDAHRLRVVRETGLHDPDAADALGHLTSLAVRTLEVGTAFVSVVDREHVIVRAARGAPDPIIRAGTLPVEESFCKNVVARDEPLVVPDVRKARDSAGNRFAAENCLVSYLEVPIRVGEEERVVGGFGVGHDGPRQWTEDEVEVVTMLAAGAATELELRREIRRLRQREAELEHQALHDSLTGLANRQLFWHRVENAVARADRTGGETAVLFLDVDDFKSVNDRHGHLTGDEVLTEIGRLLKECVREPDSVARFGGDEFTVLLEDLDAPDEADRVAERITRRLSDPLDASGSSLEVTVSIGVATSGPAAELEDKEEDAGVPGGPAASVSPGRRLVQRADWAMYRGRQEGRNSWERY